MQHRNAATKTFRKRSAWHFRKLAEGTTGHTPSVTLAMLDPKDRPNPLAATFTDAREVSYIKRERSRSCLATLKLDDKTDIPTGYIIGPNQNGR